MAALIVSIVALVLSIGSLSWQVWSWRRSGPVVRVTVSNIVPTYQGQGTGDWHTAVTATNTGRAATTVTTWAFELPNGHNSFTIYPVPISAPLPFRLEAHASASWYVPTQELMTMCAENHVDHKELRAWVEVGTGKVYADKRGIARA